MLKQHVIACLGISSLLVFGFLSVSLLESTEALEWKWTKYEKWNCCANINFKPISIPESNSTNAIIQNLEINQVCDSVEICLVDLHDLNNQIAYINTEYSIK